MVLDPSLLPFLHGSKFSNSLRVPVTFEEPIPDRVKFLVDLAKGKNVIHLGCLDHQPLIEDKIRRRQWLHKELTENTAMCLGIDIDEETRRYVQKKFGFNNIVTADFTKEAPQQVGNHQWHYAVLGELLEHIDNPVAFLSAIRTQYRNSISKIVITVPNAWTQTTIRMALQSVEIINSDHRYWFTPYTLAKVMHHAGIELTEMYFTNRVPLSKFELIRHKVSNALGVTPRYNFTYASSIVAIGSL